MAKLYVICGHGAGDSGAVGGGHTEADLVRRLGRRIKELGGDDVILHDTAQNVYASRAMRSISFPSGVAVVELHMDAAGGSAHGAHVIINKAFSADSYDRHLAQALSSMMPGRAETIVGRGDLLNCNVAKSRGINYRLIENGFIDNAGDREYFLAHIDDIARVYLEGLDIEATGCGSAPEPETPSLDLGDIRWTGPLMVKELQRQLGTPDDGEIWGQWSGNKKYHMRLSTVKYDGGGSPMVKALQRKVGSDDDGHLGVNTISALQRWLISRGYDCGSYGANGYYGKDTSAAVARALKDGAFK